MLIFTLIFLAFYGNILVMGLNFKLDASTLSVLVAGRLLSVIRQFSITAKQFLNRVAEVLVPQRALALA